MSPHKIGNVEVPPVGYGAMGIAAFHGPVLPDEERLKILDFVYENGCTHWDTADVYGDSEYLIGKWFIKTGKRDKIFLATKFGFVHGQPLPDGRAICGDPEYAVKALNRSLSRLGVECIDLWYLHRADKTVPIELTVKAMAEQVKAGKVKYIGLSEVSADTLRRAHAVHPIAALQVEYSIFTLDIEDDKLGILKAARELGVKIIPFSPTGGGLLTGKYRSPEDFDASDSRLGQPRYTRENFPNILKLVDDIRTIADKHHATPAQVAIAWLLAQGSDVLPIPGSTNPENIKANIEAQNVKLAVEEVARLRELGLATAQTVGPRSSEFLASLAFVDTPPLN